MEKRLALFFPPFHLDLETEQLWHADEPIALRPKNFAVLRYLVEHPDCLVTKDELLDVVWAEIVSDTMLTTSYQLPIPDPWPSPLKQKPKPAS